MLAQHATRTRCTVLAAHACRPQWDLARLPWSSRRGARWLSSGLPTPWLDSWRANFTAWLSLLRQELPQVRLGWGELGCGVCGVRTAKSVSCWSWWLQARCLQRV